MGLTLIVDGENVPATDEDAVNRGFESIEPTAGWRKALSIVELCKDESHSLAASGHPVDGWSYLCLIEGDSELTSFPDPPLPQSKIIEVFRAYRRGDNSWMSGFKWGHQGTFVPGHWNTSRNLIALIGVFLLLVFVLRWLWGY